jgi:hypothetical protein
MLCFTMTVEFDAADEVAILEAAKVYQERRARLHPPEIQSHAGVADTDPDSWPDMFGTGRE